MIKSPIQLCIPEISNHEIETVSKVFKTGWLAHGEWNKKFENSIGVFISSNLILFISIPKKISLFFIIIN